MRSNWYWFFEFGGNAIGLLMVGWSAMLFGGIATTGSITFIENNPWILWTEIVLVILAGIVVSINLVNDILKFSKDS